MAPMRAKRSMKRDLPIIFALLMLTAAAFHGAGGCGFTIFDDYAYIRDNPNVLTGISWVNVKWAFSGFHQGNYIPLTWISLMLNASLFAPAASGFHWVNLAFHGANVILVYIWFRSATGAIWRSALTAAIFAVHPLRVESVVWAVERKDVLTAFLGLLAMLCYLRFIIGMKGRWYAGVLFFFAAALLAKQTFATLPFLLLLLDYWPLGRWVRGPSPCNPLSSTNPRRTLPWLILEKAPLAIMMAASSVITVKAQATTGSVTSLEVVPVAQRLANVPISYVRYLGKMVWFGHLAVYYPLQTWPIAQVARATAVLVAVTAFTLLKLRSSPWLAIGWVWFLGVLTPMIGLIQFASQSLADRFTYLAGIGLLVMAVWSIPSRLTRDMPVLTAVMAAAVLSTLCVFTIEQTAYWQNNVTLFAHDIQVAGSNFLAENNLGVGLMETDEAARAIPHLIASIRLNPRLPDAYYNLACAYIKTGRYDKAYPCLREATLLNPTDAATRDLFAFLLSETGKYREAAQERKTK